MSRLIRGLLLAWLATNLVGCHRVPARLPDQTQDLEVPLPPAHVLLPVTLAAATEPPSEPPAPPAAATPPPVRPTTATRPPAPTTPAAAPPPVAEAPAPVLQTAPDVSAAEQKIRAQLQAAERDLDRVRYPELSASAKDHYAMARGYVQNAIGALKIKNYPYAEQLADRAAVLASLLNKR